MKKKTFILTAILITSIIFGGCETQTVTTPPPPPAITGAIILTTSDTGANWQSHTIQGLTGNYASVFRITSFVYDLNSLCLLSTKGDYPNTGYVMNSADAGFNWTTAVTTSGDYLYDMTKTGTDGKGFCLQGGLIRMTTDNGSNWSDVQSIIMGSGLRSIDFSDVLRGMIISGVNDESNYITTNGGTNWTPVPPVPDSVGNIYAVKFTGSFSRTEAVVCGSNGKIFRTSDMGYTWSESSSPTTELLNGIDFYDPIGIIVGNNGTILRTSDGGYFWEAVPSGVTNNLRKVFVESLYYWAIGDGVILKSSDQGQTWTVVRSVPGEYYKDLYFSKDAGIVVGSGHY